MAPLMCSFCFASEQGSAWPEKPSACVCLPRGVHGILQWDCAGRDTALPMLAPLSPHTRRILNSKQEVVRMRGFVPSIAPQSISQFLFQMPSFGIFW